MDVVKPGELVLVQQQRGRVQDQLGGRPAGGSRWMPGIQTVSVKVGRSVTKRRDVGWKIPLN